VSSASIWAVRADWGTGSTQRTCPLCAKGRHTLIGTRQWISQEHIDDPAKSIVMGLPPDLRFRTKGQLAIDLLAEAATDGVWPDFVCGDDASGS